MCIVLQCHNELCYNKNASVVDRDDRQQWPATTVVRAFLDGKIDTFKKYTEEQTGDNPGDAAWQTRWNGFIKTLEDNKDNHDILKDLCSKFMTAQRTKRYRRNTTT
jgi:C1A family cysteine protease